MIGFSTADSISDTLLCGYLGAFTVLVSDSHVHLEFSARSRHREQGFIASYQGVTNDVIGKHKPIATLGLTGRQGMRCPGRGITRKLGRECAARFPKPLPYL